MKNANRLSLKNNSHNNSRNSSSNHHLFNPDNTSIKQDLLFFKNDMLKDIRKFEEKLTTKLTEQSVANNDQYEACEKKLDIINSKIIRLNNFVSDNSDLSDKINKFQSFKSKTEENILSLNSRMFITQKETKESLTKIDKILEDNLKYPGIIGKNSKFSNFRFFIDYIMNNFRILNDFKEEMQTYDFNGFKKRINSDLREFRFLVNENYRNLRKLIESNIKEFNTKVYDLNQKIDKKIEDIDNKIKDYKTNISERLSLYEEKVENKFNILHNNIEDKYKEQSNEINNIKSIKNNFINDINNVKSNLTKIEKSFDILKLSTEKNNLTSKMDNINYATENKILFGENFDNNQIKNILLEKNQIFNLPLTMKNLDSNIQIFNNNLQNYEEKTNSINTLENLTHNGNSKINLLERYNSSENSQNNDNNLQPNLYSDEHNVIKSKKENLVFTQDDLNNDKDKMNDINFDLKKPLLLNKYTNFKKAIFQNNYSIMNIPNIKIKKVVIPENINENRKMRVSKSSLFDKRKKRVMSTSIPKKYFLSNGDNLSINRNSMKNIHEIKEEAKIKNYKNKRTKGKKYIESAKIIGQRSVQRHPDDVSSILAIKTNTKNSLVKSCDNFRKNQERSWSFEKKVKTKDEKDGKDDKIQIDFRKTYKDKNQFNELLLINAKNMKKNRKIKM